MKNLIAAAFALMFVSSAAHADAYPAYTKDKGAWWVSAMLIVPVAALDAVGRAADATGKAGDTFVPLHKATKGIAENAIAGVCEIPGVSEHCK